MIMGVTKENKEDKLMVSIINQEKYKLERVEKFVFLNVVIDEVGKENTNWVQNGFKRK